MNGPKHKALLKRLRVTAYPTILYLRDGAMREYDGSQRTTAALAAFGRSGYKDTPPVPWYRAPNGLAGKLTGAFFRLPVLAGALYAKVKAHTGAGDATVLLIGLAAPVALGVLAVAAADAYVTRAAKRAGARRRQREAGNRARARRPARRLTRLTRAARDLFVAARRFSLYYSDHRIVYYASSTSRSISFQDPCGRTDRLAMHNEEISRWPHPALLRASRVARRGHARLVSRATYTHTEHTNVHP